MACAPTTSRIGRLEFGAAIYSRTNIPLVDGKFRRPADLWTPNFDVPMRDSLLWVYEGMTQYYGYV